MKLVMRIVSECWQPILVDDVPEKWLPVLHSRPKKFEDGRLTDNPYSVCGTIALTMPDEPSCLIYKH